MSRPLGLSRAAVIALACAAFLAIAMIPRGVVRAVDVSQLGDGAPAPSGEVSLAESDEGLLELAGVRAIVAREERDLPTTASEGADSPRPAPAAHAVDSRRALVGSPVPAASPAGADLASGPRAPPTPI